MAQIVCVLALLCFASCVVENSGTMQEFKDLQLQQDSLPWLQKLQDKQELMQKQNIVQLLYRLFKSEKPMILQGTKGTERQEKERRGLDKGVTTLARRAGCRVFFWKSWTAC
ncbi:somatostatin-1-like [Scomber japonicus]|uniref:somatostatin-1-like n=1 Tax=Scomber japonicus TaxID=13676 RepID=UPI002305383E|nr:somatostatin-1-like [Scomber japonicus]